MGCVGGGRADDERPKTGDFFDRCRVEDWRPSISTDPPQLDSGSDSGSALEWGWQGDFCARKGQDGVEGWTLAFVRSDDFWLCATRYPVRSLKPLSNCSHCDWAFEVDYQQGEVLGPPRCEAMMVDLGLTDHTPNRFGVQYESYMRYGYGAPGPRGPRMDLMRRGGWYGLYGYSYVGNRGPIESAARVDERWDRTHFEWTWTYGLGTLRY